MNTTDFTIRKMTLSDAAAVAELEKLTYPTESRMAAIKSEKQKGKVYTH